MKRLIFICFMILFVMGCVKSVGNPYADAANNLIKTKETIIVASTAISAMCLTDIIPQDTCKEVDDIYYNQLPQVYKLASDSLIYSISIKNLDEYQSNQQALIDMLNSLNNVLITYKGDK